MVGFGEKQPVSPPFSAYPLLIWLHFPGNIAFVEDDDELRPAALALIEHLVVLTDADEKAVRFRACDLLVKVCCGWHRHDRGFSQLRLALLKEDNAGKSDNIAICEWTENPRSFSILRASKCIVLLCGISFFSRAEFWFFVFFFFLRRLFVPVEKSHGPHRF